MCAKDIEDGHRVLRLLEEISTGDELTQRDLSSRSGIALGLVNTYLKNLASKGFVKISAIPAKRYKYYLTPKGFIEKTRLTYAMLKNYTHVFREARKNYSDLFRRLKDDGVRGVLFAGAGDTAEIAYLSLQEVGIEFLGIVDPEKAGDTFFGQPVRDVETVRNFGGEVHVILTSIERAEEIHESLVSNEVDAGRIYIAHMSNNKHAGKS